MNSKSKKLLESIKDQIISEVFLNEEVGLADKINFCRQLESLKKFVFDSEIETAREKGWKNRIDCQDKKYGEKVENKVDYLIYSG